MCRLLGLTAGTERVHATFWLLDAPDSLEVQSRRNVDGSGIGFFGPAGAPVLDKQPEAAFRDEDFIREAKHAESAVFVAHVRWATAGGRTLQNTHPFAMQGRIMAHNGGFGDLRRLEEQLFDGHFLRQLTHRLVRVEDAERHDDGARPARHGMNVDVAPVRQQH